MGAELKLWADQIGEEEPRKKEQVGLRFRIVDELFVRDALEAFVVEEGYVSPDGRRFVPLDRYRIELIAGVPMLFPFP